MRVAIAFTLTFMYTHTRDMLVSCFIQSAFTFPIAFISNASNLQSCSCSQSHFHIRILNHAFMIFMHFVKLVVFEFWLISAKLSMSGHFLILVNLREKMIRKVRSILIIRTTCILHPCKYWFTYTVCFFY